MLPYPEHPLLSRDFGVRPWAGEHEGCLRNFFNTDTGSRDALVYASVP